MVLSDDEVQARRMLGDLTGDQPPAPPDRYRAVRQRVSRGRRRRSAQVLALALVVTGGGLGVGLHVGTSQAGDSGHGPVTIRGVLAVSRPSASLRKSCPGPSAATGVPHNAGVTVRSPSGAVIGLAKLGLGTPDPAGVSCDYPFTLKRLPAESRYRLSVGNGPTAWLTPGQVNGRIMLRFGIRTPVAKLTGSDTTANDGFGTSLAMSGGLIVVGAPGHAAGRVYVFTPKAGGWRQSAELTGSGTGPGDSFGASVAVSDSTIVVGAPGHAAGRVYVFTPAAGGWRQSAELTGSGTGPGGEFGASVAVSGGTIVVGSIGRAYAFSRTLGHWSQSAAIEGFPNLNSATAVAASGATIVLSSEGSLSRTDIYVKTAGGWKRAARLDTQGLGGFLQAAMSANIIVITGQGPGCGTGGAEVFTSTGRDWKQVATMLGDGCFGVSVAVSGSSIAVGGAEVPAAYVFSPTAGGWQQSAELTGPTRGAQRFRSGVAISGQTVVWGSVGPEARGHGLVYVFRL